MKLLHITMHTSAVGGIPAVLKNLSREQNKINGFTAKVVSLVKSNNDETSENFEYVDINNFSSYVDKYKPDIVILHSFYYLKYNKVVNVLNRKKIPYYIEPHGSFVKKSMQKSGLKKYIANHTVFLKQLKSAYGYIFLNLEEMQKSLYRTKNDVIIPNGVSKEKIVKKINNDNKMNFYYIGRYDIIGKGIDCLFDALDILDKDKVAFTINFWGKGDEKSLKYMNDRIKNYQFVTVNIFDSIIGNEKDKRLEQLGPMILASRHEGFPMSVLEAWSYGNPCIVTTDTNVSNETETNKLGWVIELKSVSIVEVIKKALDDYRSNRSEYISRCKNYVESNYDWSIIAKKSYELLNNRKK